MDTLQVSVARPNTLRQNSDCEAVFMNTLRCFSLCDAEPTDHGTDHGTLLHTIFFILSCSFDHSMLGVNVK